MMNSTLRQMAETIDPAAFMPSSRDELAPTYSQATAYRKAKAVAEILRRAWEDALISETSGRD